MILWLWLVLLEDAEDTGSTATVADCSNAEGICDACITVNEGLPYWNGTSCVSCATGTNDEDKFFDADDKVCVTKCPFTNDKNNVCKTCVDINPKSPVWTGTECAVRCANN